jgi:hypothetical protein
MKAEFEKSRHKPQSADHDHSVKRRMGLGTTWKYEYLRLEQMVVAFRELLIAKPEYFPLCFYMG